jgi:hypothetical protein
MCAGESVSPDILVVCPTEFRETMQPWLERRTKQGHSVRFVSNLGTADEIRDEIRATAKNGKLRFVVLVGDAPPLEIKPPQAQGLQPLGLRNTTAPPVDPPRSLRTPTFSMPTKMDLFWGGDPEMATDNPYADLDGDGVPELAIGRLTAHSAEELSTILKKILAYEDSRDFGPWRTHINFVAGEGGYGALTDATIEMFARKVITWGVPAAYQLTMTDAVWASPYCPSPSKFHDCCLERMNEGCLFWVFMGHGSPRTLQWANFPDGSTPILRCEDCAGLHCGATPAIAMFFCCYTGAFAQHEDCLAEELLRSPGGPVAVFSGSNVTMPYGMGAMGWQAIREYFVNHRETLGELMLSAKRDTMAGYELPIWSLTTALTAAVAPEGVHPKEERLEHLQLFNLFGDPTMRLPYPREVKFQTPQAATAGETLKVQGESSVNGTASVELVVPLDRIQLPRRDRYESSAKARKEFDATYERANNPRLAAVSTEVRDGHFSAELPIPKDVSGLCSVRIFVQGKDDCAVGASKLRIADAKSTGANGAILGVGSSR